MMAADHTSHHDDLLPAYALGALDGAELREIEAHLASGCPECSRQLTLWRGDLEQLAASVPPVAPSPETRQRVLRMAHRERPARWWPLAAAALLAFTLGAGWRQAQLGPLEPEVERLRAENARLEQGVAQARSQAQAEIVRMKATLAILSQPGARSVALAGLPAAPGAVGHTFVDPAHGKALFWAFHLPPPSVGKTYQLWWIGDSGPVSAGTFPVDAAGEGLLEVGVERPDAIRAWAVTVEPAGGVPQPTGAMVLKG
jgi:anti-sigma-K factor RskA